MVAGSAFCSPCRSSRSHTACLHIAWSSTARPRARFRWGGLDDPNLLGCCLALPPRPAGALWTVDVTSIAAGSRTPKSSGHVYADGGNTMKVVSLSGLIPIVLTVALSVPALAQDASGQRS